MQIVFVHTFTCPCGGQEHGVLVSTARVNKNSIVQLNGLGANPESCRRCGRRFEDGDPMRTTIDSTCMGKINDYRVDRGWPPLPNALVFRDGEALHYGSPMSEQPVEADKVGQEETPNPDRHDDGAHTGTGGSGDNTGGEDRPEDGTPKPE